MVHVQEIRSRLYAVADGWSESLSDSERSTGIGRRTVLGKPFFDVLQEALEFSTTLLFAAA